MRATCRSHLFGKPTTHANRSVRRRGTDAAPPTPGPNGWITSRRANSRRRTAPSVPCPEQRDMACEASRSRRAVSGEDESTEGQRGR